MGKISQNIQVYVHLNSIVHNLTIVRNLTIPSTSQAILDVRLICWRGLKRCSQGSHIDTS
jgi:hypothetical protein